MLEIQNVSKTFNAGTVNEKTALNGLNLKLNEGDFVTVIGGNGAGKSTMLNAVAGVWPVDSGKIIIDGTAAVYAAADGGGQRLYPAAGPRSAGSAYCSCRLRHPQPRL